MFEQFQQGDDRSPGHSLDREQRNGDVLFGKTDTQQLTLEQDRNKVRVRLQRLAIVDRVFEDPAVPVAGCVGGCTNLGERQLGLPNGYRVDVEVPLERLRISYDDPLRDNSFDVTMTAIMPAVMLASGKHFDQAMRTDGWVTLRGSRHRVAGYTVRDRSWSEIRPEDPRQAPPVHWLTGIVDDQVAFHVTGIEDLADTPMWSAVYPQAPAAVGFNRGWVWRDGEVRALHDVSIRCRWDSATGYQRTFEVAAIDDQGQPLTATGAVRAINNWNTWSNVCIAVGLVEWQVNGRVAYGDTQAALWTDLFHHLETKLDA